MYKVLGVTLLLLLNGNTPVEQSSAACEQDCQQAVEAALRRVAIEYQIAVSELTVNVHHSGFEFGRGPFSERSRPIGSELIRQLSDRIGFSVEPLVKFDDATYVTFFAPEFDDDHATMIVGVATYSIRQYDLLNIALQRSTAGWMVREVRIIFRSPIDFIPVPPHRRP